jgi:hypothetical protein
MNFLNNEIEAIKTHDLVSSLNILRDEELEIKFVEGYNDLIIPLSPEMTTDNLMTVFYYYIENYKGI